MIAMAALMSHSRLQNARSNPHEKHPCKASPTTRMRLSLRSHSTVMITPSHDPITPLQSRPATSLCDDKEESRKYLAHLVLQCPKTPCLDVSSPHTRVGLSLSTYGSPSGVKADKSQPVAVVHLGGCCSRWTRYHSDVKMNESEQDDYDRVRKL